MLSKNCWRYIFRCIGIMLFLGLSLTFASAREWQLRDSIEWKYFSGVSENPLLWPKPKEYLKQRYVTFSPDRRSFLLIRHWGDIEKDANVFQLLVYNADSIRVWIEGAARSKAVEPPPDPIMVAKFESDSPSMNAINGVRWSDDSKEITLQIKDRIYGQGIFRLIPAKNQILKIRKTEQSFHKYRYEHGVLIATNFGASNKGLQDNQSPFIRIARLESGQPTLVPKSGDAQISTLVVNDRNVAFSIQSQATDWSVAPSGRFAVGKILLGSSSKYELLNLETGQTITINEISERGDILPISCVSWGRNGETLFLGNEQLRQNIKSTIIPSVDGKVSSASLQIKVRPCDRKVGFPEPVWGTDPNENQDNFKIEIRESFSQPQRVVVTKGDIAADLIEWDAGLRELELSKRKIVTWDEQIGTVSGLLTVPRGKAPPNGWPLIVELVGHSTSENFLPDGPLAAAFASQLYAAHGYAVLEVPSIKEKIYRKEREGPQATTRIDLAIDAVLKQSSIDKSKLALIGHSRTGYQSLYTLSHPGSARFVAGVLIDSSTDTYRRYLFEGARFAITDDLLKRFLKPVGDSFWSDNKGWLEHEISFNVDKITTPILFTVHGAHPGGSNDYVSEDIIGSFNYNCKALEYLWYPDGEHVLVKPSHRLALLKESLGWLDYWIREKFRYDQRYVPQWCNYNIQSHEGSSRE